MDYIYYISFFFGWVFFLSSTGYILSVYIYPGALRVTLGGEMYSPVPAPPKYGPPVPDNPAGWKSHPPPAPAEEIAIPRQEAVSNLAMLTV
jgi:hypothetical protein